MTSLTAIALSVVRTSATMLPMTACIALHVTSGQKKTAEIRSADSALTGRKIRCLLRISHVDTRKII